MKLYGQGAQIGHVVKSYGDSLMMIKRADGQARCLFFAVIEIENVQTLVALLAFKKKRRSCGNDYET